MSSIRNSSFSESQGAVAVVAATAVSRIGPDFVVVLGNVGASTQGPRPGEARSYLAVLSRSEHGQAAFPPKFSGGVPRMGRRCLVPTFFCEHSHPSYQ